MVAGDDDRRTRRPHDRPRPRHLSQRVGQRVELAADQPDLGHDAGIGSRHLAVDGQVAGFRAPDEEGQVRRGAAARRGDELVAARGGGRGVHAHRRQQPRGRLQRRGAAQQEQRGGGHRWWRWR